MDRAWRDTGRSPSTLCGHRSKAIRIKAGPLGDVDVAMISTLDLDRYYCSLPKDGMSPANLPHHHRMIRAAVSQAKKRSMVPRIRPTTSTSEQSRRRRCTCPRSTRHERSSFGRREHLPRARAESEAATAGVPLSAVAFVSGRHRLTDCPPGHRTALHHCTECELSVDGWVFMRLVLKIMGNHAEGEGVAALAIPGDGFRGRWRPGARLNTRDRVGAESLVSRCRQRGTGQPTACRGQSSPVDPVARNVTFR